MALLRAALLTLLLVLSTATASLAQPPFRLPGTFPVGGVPFDLMVRDLNGDGHLDVLSTNFDSGTITVLLGTGTGDFTPLEDQPANGAPLKVVSLFADDDPNLDLIVSENESDFIYLLRGHGDGTFGEAEPIDAGHDPYALAIADMNHDSILDVVVSIATEGAGGRVNVLLGEGDGHYSFDVEAHGRRLNASSYAVVVGDFNEDGHNDVAATTIGRPSGCPSTNCGTLAILLGDGTGALARSLDFATGGAPFPLVAADLDHDGHLDIVTGDSGDNSLSVYKGSGKVPVTPEDLAFFQRIAVIPVGVTPGSIVLTDFEADGWLDLVVGNFRSSDVSVLPGLPGGAFGPGRSFLSGLTLKGADVGDFNEDTRLDLVAINDGDLEPNVSVMLARAEGGYDAGQTLMPTSEQASIAVGDIRGNGVPVIALNITAASETRLLTPEGVQRFSQPLAVPLGFKPNHGALRDLNGDGRADLIAAANTPLVGVALADGQGSFGSVTPLVLTGVPTGLGVADLDHDGNLDLLLPIGTPAGVGVLFGNGDGSFEPLITQTLTGRPGSIAIGDFNRDGIEDAAIGNAQENALALLNGNSERSLAGSTFALPAAGTGLASADLDSDGYDDLVVNTGNLLRLLWGNGEGSFAASGQISLGRPAAALAARDVDGDLRPDILASILGTNEMRIVRNEGNRSFGQQQPILLGLRPGSIAVADFDLDGRYDIGVSGAYGWALTSEVEVAFTRGDGNADGLFSVADLVSLRGARARGSRVEDILRAPEQARPTAGADANGDGRVDLADELLTIGRLFD